MMTLNIFFSNASETSLDARSAKLKEEKETLYFSTKNFYATPKLKAIGIYSYRSFCREKKQNPPPPQKTTTDYFNSPTQTDIRLQYLFLQNPSLYPSMAPIIEKPYLSIPAQCTVHTAPPTSFAPLLTLFKYPIVFSFSVPRSIQRQTPHYLSYLVLTKSRLNIKVFIIFYQQGKDERAR